MNPSELLPLLEIRDDTTSGARLRAILEAAGG